jgi:hypothetical protein
MRWLKTHFPQVGALFLFVGLCSCLVSGYSVLTHEQVVDLMWNDQIQPLLLKRFPGATAEDLQKAHAYAYGDLNAPNATRKDAKAWRQLQDQLQQLKQRDAMTPVEQPSALNQ